MFFTKSTNNKLFTHVKTTSKMWHRHIRANTWNKTKQQPLTNSVSWKYYRIHHTAIAVKVSYLVLVDEEEHDGQNLQEEDEQEQNEELRRHKGKKRGQLSDWIQHLSGRRRRPRGDNRHLSLESLGSTNWREWKRADTRLRRDEVNRERKKEMSKRSAAGQSTMIHEL